jgi:hypothetical protein
MADLLVPNLQCCVSILPDCISFGRDPYLFACERQTRKRPTQDADEDRAAARFAHVPVIEGQIKLSKRDRFPQWRLEASRRDWTIGNGNPARTDL